MGLDDDHDPRECCDDSVASREPPRLGRLARRRLGDDGACDCDPSPQFGMPSGIGRVDAAGGDTERPGAAGGRQCPLMGGTVDAERQSRYNAHVTSG
jgi:hypothetical protein